MIHTRLSFRLRPLAIAVTVFVAGCSSDALHFTESSSADRQSVTQWQQPQGSDAQSATALTVLIDDATLTALVNEALTNSPGLHQTWLTLRIAQASRDQTAAAQWPDLDASFSAGRSKDDDGINNSASTSVTVSWELDLWQKLADQTAAADASTEASRADFIAARNTLAADVMTTWINQIALAQLATLADQQVTLSQSNMDLVLARYRAGLKTLDDLDTARTSLHNNEATAAAYRENLAAGARTLEQLLGHVTPASPAIPADFPAVILPLADLPDQNLAARPDLIAAYHTIESAQYSVSVAQKDLLPSISLSAALSDSATTPRQSLLTSPAWSLLGTLTAPLFDGGERRAAITSAELTAEQAYYAYRETLITAVKEVEDALGQEQALARQEAALDQAVASAERSYANARERYRQGLIDVFDLISAQQTLFSTRSDWITTRTSRLTNRVTLGQALGLPAVPPESRSESQS